MCNKRFLAQLVWVLLRERLPAEPLKTSSHHTHRHMSHVEDCVGKSVPVSNVTVNCSALVEFL